jgi:branched-chain amino acid transport system permease protein
VVADVIQQIISGLAIGGIYALVGLAFSLTVRATNIINFATGELFMLGAYFGITFAAFLKLPFWLAVPCTIVVVALVGIGFEKAAFKPLWKSHHVVQIMSTIGCSFFLQNATMLIWGSESLPFPQIFPREPLNLHGVVLPVEYLWIIGMAVVFMFILHTFLQKTKIGRGLRAAAQDRETAALMGVNLSSADSLVFGLSAALGAVGGILFAPTSFADPTMGLPYGVKGFTAAVVGGLGSIPGAIVGGILLGVSESLITGFVSSVYKDVVAFAILIVFLIWRPTGLLLKPPQQKV